MTHSEAKNEIQTFWPDPYPFIGCKEESEIHRIENEIGSDLPESIRTYIVEACPTNSVLLKSVGNPIDIYSSSMLGGRHLGYTHTDDGAVLSEWLSSWFLIADEGGDPLIIDMKTKASRLVCRAMHGAGEWNFHPEADTVGQFLLCASAVHHALTYWGRDVITDNASGFCLCDEPAKWLFPRMRDWAGVYYEDWCSVFDNH